MHFQRWPIWFGRAGIFALVLNQAVRFAEIFQLRLRRGSADEAQACYRVLDPQAEVAIAGSKSLQDKGNAP